MPTIRAQLSKMSIELAATRSQTRAGHRIALRGKVFPTLAAQRILLERRVRSGWRRVARRTLDRRSRFRVALTASWVDEREFRAEARRLLGRDDG